MALTKSREILVESTKQEAKIRSVGDYLIPIMSVFVFILLTIFVFVPMITDAVKLRKDIAEIEDKQTQLESKLRAMQPFVDNKVALFQDEKIFKTVIPSALDVADFTFYVDELAKENDLTFKEISSGNINVSSVGVANEALASNVSGVSGPIVYEGEYNDIVTFLDILQVESPYIVETRTISLNRRIRDEDNENVEIWTVELNITGYYISKQLGSENIVETDSIRLYDQFIPYNTDQDSLNIFKEKAGVISSE